MKTLLCAIAKCENKYLMEWITWHLKLGFDRIVIYDNNDLNGEKISDVVGELANVKIIDWRGKEQKSCEIQVAAYNDCYKKHADYEWMLFSDIDEFLEFKDFKNVKDYLSQSWVRHANVIKIHWKCYSDNDCLYTQNGSVTETYTKECTNGSVNNYTKSFYRGGLKDLKIKNVHYSSQIGGVYYQNGVCTQYSSSTTDNNINHECCWLRHYVTKSLEEYIRVKYARRSNGSSKTRLSKDFYFKYNKRTNEKEKLFDAIMSEYVTDTIEKTEIKKKQRVMLNVVDTEPAWCRMTPKVRKEESKKEVRTKQETKIIKQKNVRSMPEMSKTVVEPAWCRMTPKTKKPAVSIQQEKMIANPKGISICISAWNAQDYIEECLDSVERQTWFKTHDDWEVIVGIDGCGKTLEKVKSIMHKYRNLKVLMMDSNKGTYVTCNTIMKEAKYDWLLRFDSDDIMLPDMVEKAMNSIGDYDILQYKCITFSNENFKFNSYDNYCNGSVLVKKNIILKYGGWKPWPCVADKEFLVRLSKCAKIKYLNERLFKYRRLQESISLSKDKLDARNKFVKIIKDEQENGIATPYIKCITNTYAEIFNNTCKDTIIVNITTYPKRDAYLFNMLTHFKKQTRKPDKIILWLSKDEYDEKQLPKTIQRCIDNKLLTDVKFLPKNIYCHKRHECFKYYNYAYNIFVDDDIIYPNDFVDKLYVYAKKYKVPVSYYCKNMNYTGTTRSTLSFSPGPSITNRYYGGLSCIPPYVFPLESYQYEKYRDKYCPKCDESWLQMWLIKKNIPVYGIYEWKGNNVPVLLENTQFTSLWNENKQCINGVLKKVENIAKCIVFLDIEQKASNLWKDFDVKRSCNGMYDEIHRNAMKKD